MSETDDPFLKQIGKRLKELRQGAKLTQVQLAKTVALDYRHYQNLEAGQSNFKITTIKKLADFYGISIANFFEDQIFQDTELKPQQLLLSDHNGNAKFTKAVVEKNKTSWDNLEIGVQVYNKDGLITYVNNYWAKMLGDDRSQIENKKHFWDFVIDKNKEHLKQYFSFLLQNRPPPKTYIDEGSVAQVAPYMIRAEWDYLYNDSATETEGMVLLMWPIRPGSAATELPENTVH